MEFLFLLSGSQTLRSRMIIVRGSRVWIHHQPHQRLIMGSSSCSHHHHLLRPSPQLVPTKATDTQVPLPSPEVCGPVTVTLDGGQRGGRENRGRMCREAVSHKYGPRLSSWPIFSLPFFLSIPNAFDPPLFANPTTTPRSNTKRRNPRRRWQPNPYHRHHTPTTVNEAAWQPTTMWAAQP